MRVLSSKGLLPLKGATAQNTDFSALATSSRPKPVTPFRRSAGGVANLYRCRWQIEVFLKQIKQSLQLCDFLGNSANAVRWQVCTALLLYVLMRFLCVISSWSHSFTRLFTLLASGALEKN